MNPLPQPRAEADLLGALLRADRDDALLQDQIDAADLLLSSGLREAAAALYGAVLLQTGLTAATAAMLREAGGQERIWGVVADERPVASSTFAVDQAIAELRTLTALPIALLAAATEAPSLPPLPDLMPPPPPIGRGRSALVAHAGRIAGLVRALPEIGFEVPTDRLREEAEALLTLDPLHLNEHLDAGAAAMAELLVLERVRRFVVMQIDLLRSAPDGLFARAARLHPAALGPWFGNVPRLIRDVRDLFAMIDAASGGDAGVDAIETWCVLLSSHLRHHQLNELIDELGDRGMVCALGAILRRVERRGTFQPWSDTVRRIRDVCLDIGEYGVAAQAQLVAATWSKFDANEWKILGEIAASAGQAEQAEAAYRRAAFLAPNALTVQQELADLSIGKQPMLAGGYEVSPVRRQLRLARMEAYRSGSEGTDRD